jgi:HEAT repeat protein
MRLISVAIIIIIALMTSAQCQKTTEDYIHILENGSIDDKRDAIDALRELKDPKAIDPLIKALNDTSDRYSIRQEAVWALAAINNTRAVGLPGLQPAVL